VEVSRAAAVLRRREAVLLVRRNHPTLLDGTWEFPGVDLTPGEDPREKLVLHLEELLGTRVGVGEEIATVRHSITHRRLHVSGYRAESEPLPRARRGARAWVGVDGLADYPVSSLTAKLLAACRNPE
jgi:adenine-specific DNA glycosylase